MSYKCKNCGNPIKSKTARRYRGYSLQCLRKIENEKNQLPLTFNEIADNLSQVNEIISKDYNIKVICPGAYSEGQFKYIYAIPRHSINKYYNNYLVKFVNELTI